MTTDRPNVARSIPPAAYMGCVVGVLLLVVGVPARASFVELTDETTPMTWAVPYPDPLPCTRAGVGRAACECRMANLRYRHGAAMEAAWSNAIGDCAAVEPPSLTRGGTDSLGDFRDYFAGAAPLKETE